MDGWLASTDLGLPPHGGFAIEDFATIAQADRAQTVRHDCRSQAEGAFLRVNHIIRAHTEDQDGIVITQPDGDDAIAGAKPNRGDHGLRISDPDVPVICDDQLHVLN
ncbi:hypothetical protein FALBO_10631 [Fusarium albosuccineum]|uniref:Uncharacterized protein n=1 Tax=Fusarium albosuccineum TaxID=1237068 RepID=A0A8H4PIC6_9HYPO|nr:hypothetical protein FALBO_10631 [Fusarium albosuccineum]